MKQKFFTITFYPDDKSCILSGYNLWAFDMLEAVKKHYEMYPGIHPHYIHYKPDIQL